VNRYTKPSKGPSIGILRRFVVNTELVHTTITNNKRRVRYASTLSLTGITTLLGHLSSRCDLLLDNPCWLDRRTLCLVWLDIDRAASRSVWLANIPSSATFTGDKFTILFVVSKRSSESLAGSYRGDHPLCRGPPNPTSHLRSP
jgi:hypothetical protein